MVENFEYAIFDEGINDLETPVTNTKQIIFSLGRLPLSDLKEATTILPLTLKDQDNKFTYIQYITVCLSDCLSVCMWARSLSPIAYSS